MTVLVEAVHTVKPLTNSTFDAWVDWYGEAVIPAMQRSGFDIIGAFKRWGGPMGQDVLIMRFESMDHYNKAGIALRKDEGFLKSYANARQFTVTESVKLAALVPYATEARLEKALSARPEQPRQYMQAVLNVVTGGQPKAYESIGKLADLTDGGKGINLALAYETTVGQRGEVTDIWVCPSGPLPMGYRPGDPMKDLISDLRSVAPDESTYYLNPLPYSPLQ